MLASVTAQIIRQIKKQKYSIESNITILGCTLFLSPGFLSQRQQNTSLWILTAEMFILSSVPVLHHMQKAQITENQPVPITNMYVLFTASTLCPKEASSF